MNKQFLIITALFLLIMLPVKAQQPGVYRETAPKINSLVHTELEVSFDNRKELLFGKAWITLQPYAYTLDSLTLDAKSMLIHGLALIKAGKKQPLKYTYDSAQLHIKLDKPYRPGEKYTIYIAYTAQPALVKSQGSSAITSARGLYFTNPDSTIPGKPVQIWTQGETEASSAWFPTIDKPNQKMTTEIRMTVPAAYTTLSNGRLAAQHSNGDGTRTDTWKMEQPHAPYLVMMATGMYYIYKDKWKNKEVSYYVEPAQAPYAKELFANTPEMMTFISNTLGVDYPWNKYAQIIVRDFVSGAMENTTATVHGDFTYQNDRQLIDDRVWDGNIVHELFHQWFGDYVTTESWSNLTVNESFANYSETLWQEYKYGQDAGDYTNNNALELYLDGGPADEQKNLVRFYYDTQEDVIDRVTYQKGGRILHMLRNYLGKEVFYKGLHLYLTQNAFKTGEAQQLRLALEEASGRDLNWFFNQWYYDSGHPYLDIQYNWDAATGTQTVYVQQTQAGKIFTLPFAIDIYTNGKKERHEVWMKQKADTFRFALPSRPELVNVDADKVLLAVKTDHRSLQEYAYQYFHAPLYMDRLEAIQKAAASQQDAAARDVLIAACKDKFYRLRIRAMDSLNMQNPEVRAAALPLLLNLARTDSFTLVQAAAIKAIGRLKDTSYMALFREKINSRSYGVQAAAISAMAAANMPEAKRYAAMLEKDSKDYLNWALAAVYVTSGDTTKLDFFSRTLDNMFTNMKSRVVVGYLKLLEQTNDNATFTANFEKALKHVRDYKPYNLQGRFVPVLQSIKDRKTAAHLDAQANMASAAIQEMTAP
ncbi:MAG TPA: M1 family metallopeptidase [Chitinophaga sp.]|uniref:M1 family metallopeptidase n=1 Tax=Chitinophaga sp. TaxID=1869181 RepID=UPI002F933FF9